VCLENTSLRRARYYLVTYTETLVNRNVTAILRVIKGKYWVRCENFAPMASSTHEQDLPWRRCVAAHFGEAQPCAHETASNSQAKTPPTGLGNVLGSSRELPVDARDLGCGGAYAFALAQTLLSHRGTSERSRAQHSPHRRATPRLAEPDPQLECRAARYYGANATSPSLKPR